VGRHSGKSLRGKFDVSNFARTGRHKLGMAVRTPHRIGAVTVVFALLGAALSVGIAAVTGIVPADAAPGNPGTTSAPTVVYTEDFENGTGTAPVALTAYVGAPPTSATYTAAAVWRTGCNGNIVEFNSPDSGLGATNCGSLGSYTNVRGLAYAIGSFAGSGTPGTNHAVTAYTENNPGVNAIQFATVNPIPLASSSGRYLTFSVDTAAQNCGVSAPLYNFSLINGGTATPVGGTVNACTSGQTVPVPGGGTTNAGTFTSNGSVLFTGSAVGIRMTNANGSGVGNDAAFDNIRILDVTPQLDKSFSPTSITTGQTSALTFTVTNTSELASKNGWSFTDALPAGLTVGLPAATTTCPAGAVTAPYGATSVSVTGNLSAGMASCTVTVRVKSATTGSYTNGPANVTQTGLNAPGSTDLTVTAPPAWTCSAFGYLFQSPNGDAAPHNIEQIDLATGAASNPADTPGSINAVGYNTLDNYVYGIASQTGPVSGHLMRVGIDGSWTDLGIPAGLGATFNVGDFDNAGHLWVTTSGTTSSYAEIDLAPGSPTFGTVIASGSKTSPASITDPGADWTWINGALYSVGANSAGTAILVRFTPATGALANLGALSGGLTNLLVGATYADASGYLYASDNSTGRIFRIDTTTRQAILVSNGPASGGNDGARCALAPIPTITVSKVVAGRVQPADQFTVGIRNAGGTVLTSATTAGAATTATTANWPVTQGATYTITDAMAPGSPDALTAYVASIVCTDTTTGATVGAGGSGPGWTLAVTTTDAYSCVITNAPAVSSYTVAKSASATTVHPGGVISYSVTVTNTGTVPYTAANPATFRDDLSGVLDDASYNGDATAGATVTGATLNWSGTLAPGATQTITYSVTVRTPDNGDHNLSNAVVPTAPGGTCATIGGCTTESLVQSFSVQKTASTNAVIPGETVTYTVTVTNTGQIAYTAGDPADWSDDLSAVLDDATYNNDATNGADYTAPTLSWSGPLAIGATETFTYSVTIDNPDAGDQKLHNAVVTTNGGDCPAVTDNPACVSDVPSGSFTVAKSASATVANPGDTITYTVTVTNTGDVAYTAGTPASFTDDLSNVLDDAAYNGDATNGAIVTGTDLTWSGPLAVGADVTIVYSVTVTSPPTGDESLRNAVRPTSGGGSCATPASCVTTTAERSFTVVKTSAPGGAVHPGDVVTYTVSVTNTGTGDYTAGDPASFTDDLAAVLDDADYNGDASTGATVTGSALSWSGALAAGAVATVTYSVTVSDPDTGNHVLTNAVTPGDGGRCDAAADCATTNAVASFTLAKSSSASGAVHAGDVVTYTVTVTNTGGSAYTDTEPASFTDDLSAVLDDASYNGDASSGAIVTGETFAWSGPIAVGESVTVTYSVTVSPAGTGDGDLTNAVTPPPGIGGACGDGTCSVSNALQAFAVNKTSSTTSATPGDVVTYTITTTNTGQVDYTAGDPAIVTDDLSGVLDDASYNGDATNGANYTEPELAWGLALPVGDSITVTYSVTVDSPDTGDHSLANVVRPGSGGACDPDGACATDDPVASFTVSKAVDTANAGPGATVRYTVTVTNTGKVDYTDAVPASFTDDLSKVLDDAVYNADASAGATYAKPTISWSGALAIGASAAVSYSVTVTTPDLGDRVLANAVITPLGGNCVAGLDGDGCSVRTSIADPALAFTGAALALPLGGIGALLLIGGAAIVLLLRRRRLQH